jgi:hypothetical protein
MRFPQQLSRAVLAVILILLASPSTSITSIVTHTIPVNLSNGLEARFELSLDQDGGPFSGERSGNVLVFRNSRFVIQVNDRSAGGFVSIRVESVLARPFRLETLAMEVNVPDENMDGIWAPSDLGTESLVAALPGQYFQTVADANYGIPYLGAATASGQNVFAFGLFRQNLSANLRSRPGSDGHQLFQIKTTTSRTVTTADEIFFVSRDSAGNWFQTARRYADWVDRLTGYTPFPVGSMAFEPVYDTWYWSRDAVDDELYAVTSRVASDIGMGQFLVDSGWDTDTGEYDKWLYGRTGNYSPPSDKFPDLLQTFQFIRSTNRLGVHLWLQPFAVGRESYRYPSTAGQHIETLPEVSDLSWLGNVDWPVALPTRAGLLENVNLCPRLKATQDYLRELFNEMGSQYRPEGFWIDAIDFLPSACVAHHHHDYDTFGEGLNASLEVIRNTVLEHNPEAVIQFRGPYANLNTKPYASVWQPPDSAERPDQMRLFMLKMRPFSRGVVFASDQLYWSNELGEPQSAKAAMTAALSGVPAYGIDLVSAPAHTLRLLETWIAFYRTHKNDLTRGRFDVFGSFRHPNHVIESSGRSFAFVRQSTNDHFVARNKQQIFIFNATDSSALYVRLHADPLQQYVVTTLDRYMHQQDETMMASDSEGRLIIHTSVDEGALLVVSPKRKTLDRPTESIVH